MSPVPKRPTPGNDLEQALLEEDRAREPKPPQDPTPAAPEAAPAAAPAAAERAVLPEQREKPRPRRAATVPAPPSRPMRWKNNLPPSRVPARIDMSATRPLNVRVPIEFHYLVKVASATMGIDIQEMMIALVTVVTQDPELLVRLIDMAETDRKTLGELIHPALLAVAEGDYDQ
jgi:hypothetical protein